MSYCRMGEADIYLYQTERAITCCMCGITPLKVDVCRGKSSNKDLFLGIGALDSIGKKRRRPWKKLWLSELEWPKTYLKLARPDPFFRSRTAALAHVRLHRSRGDHVPDYVDQRLADEICSIGDIVAPFKLMKRRGWERKGRGKMNPQPFCNRETVLRQLSESADRASEAVDEAISFVAESNTRIDQGEKQSGIGKKAM